MQKHALASAHPSPLKLDTLFQSGTVTARAGRRPVGEENEARERFRLVSSFFILHSSLTDESCA
jgi:hypothetical protein